MIPFTRLVPPITHFSRRLIPPSFGFSTFFSNNFTPSFGVRDSELIDQLISEIIDTEMILSDPSEMKIKIIYDKKDVFNGNIPPLIKYLPIISIENTRFEHFISIEKPYHKIKLNREIKKILELEHLKSDKQTNDSGLIDIEVIDEKEYLFY